MKTHEWQGEQGEQPRHCGGDELEGEERRGEREKFCVGMKIWMRERQQQTSNGSSHQLLEQGASDTKELDARQSPQSPAWQWQSNALALRLTNDKGVPVASGRTSQGITPLTFRQGVDLVSAPYGGLHQLIRDLVAPPSPVVLELVLGQLKGTETDCRFACLSVDAPWGQQTGSGLQPVDRYQDEERESSSVNAVLNAAAGAHLQQHRKPKAVQCPARVPKRNLEKYLHSSGFCHSSA
ncbi:uncharacterized protein TRIREDRAFT_107469 [Trichoderma reesei QM6a]|uniref:Predicted protein n=1 Tax=Hypocrea jecorina (strain QM6a) TaxID=431241 RepID=G0RJP5_HYPJQ|nr:uncharacterized protein TRIREDRAFT_107469 [Trichoderma reesei QM6a]EGR48790.1 predicted protein [Trichoderma reesei QM6a]